MTTSRTDQFTSKATETSTLIIPTTSSQRPIVNPCKSLENRRRPERCFWSVVDCSSPSIILIPSSSNVSFPLQFRRDEDFFISSRIAFNCNESFHLQTEWTISNGSNSLLVDPNVVILSKSELFLPSRVLPFGVYQLILTVTINISSNLTRSSESAYVKINPAGITANLLPEGTSMISRGEGQDLLLNPGLYSVDLDEEQFNAEVGLSFVVFLCLWIEEFLGLDFWILLSNLRGVKFSFG